MDGLIVIDKPQGPTSFNLVHRVRGAIRQLTGERKPKVGHVGTLDPFATGVLPLCVGRATRLARFLIEGDKRYRATLRLGQTTTTEDTEGEVVQTCDWQGLEEEVVRATIEGLVGDHLQRPPIYSAIRVNGKRAYDLARAGKTPEMTPRPVTLFSVKVDAIALPDVVFTVHASKGTYIRSICRDVGEALGVGGHCLALRRLEAAGFTEGESVAPEVILEADLDGFKARLLSPSEMLRAMPALTLDEALVRQIRYGQKVWIPDGLAGEGAERVVKICDSDGELVCVGTIDTSGLLHTELVLI